jgi:hypothetical protein
VDACTNCAFFRENLFVKTRGICVRYPPQRINVHRFPEGWSVDTAFPDVFREDYCGEHLKEADHGKDNDSKAT